MDAASEYTNQDYTQADAHWEDIMSSITDLDVPFPEELNSSFTDYHEAMDRFQEAELQFGAAPDVWEQYQPQHEQLKEDLLDVQTAHEEARAPEHAQSNVAAVHDRVLAATQFFAEERAKLAAREQKMQEEIQALKDRITQMQTLIHAPELQTVHTKNMELIQMLAMQYVATLQEIREEAVQKKKPVLADLYKTASVHLHKTHDAIQNIPDRLRQYVTEKRDQAIDVTLQKIAGIFDKGIRFLEQKKQNLLHLSPLEHKEQDQKEKPEKEVEVLFPEERSNDSKQNVPAVESSVEKSFQLFMENAEKEGNAVWQKSAEERQNIQAPVLIYKDKEGNDKAFYPPTVNTLPAIQHQLNMKSKDPRWIAAKDVRETPNISIRKGAKAVEFVLFTKDKKMHTKKFFNMEDVIGKGVPTFTPTPDVRREMYVHDMMNYLATRAVYEPKASKSTMLADAKEAADKSYQEKKSIYDLSHMDYDAYKKAELESNKRLEAILQTNIEIPVPKEDYKNTFLQLLAKELRQAPENYVVRAVQKAWTELHWKEHHVIAALKEFVPQTAFDHLAKSGKTFSELLMKAAAKNLAPIKQQEQSAVR